MNVLGYDGYCFLIDMDMKFMLKGNPDLQNYQVFNVCQMSVCHITSAK
jgi:hypothetical protein